MKLKQRELLGILASTECPSCEGAKLRGCMFCDSCYGRLPENIKRNLINGLKVVSRALRRGLEYLEG